MNSTSPPTKKAKLTKCKTAKNTKSLSNESSQWVADDDVWYRSIFPEPNYSDCSNLSPHEQFEKFFDDELLEMICNESNSYAV